MRNKNEVIAILCSDLHLSLNPPVWRSAESNWLEAQKRPLLELSKLKQKYDIPIFYAGDIFDRWNSPAELINYALVYLPEGYSIPGQHDLPYHDLNSIHRSAYHTLCEAGKLTHLNETMVHFIEEDYRLFIHPFPYGTKITPLNKSEYKNLDGIHLCLAHEYTWITNFSFPGAPKKQKVPAKKNKLKGYDVAVFGDNHKGFQTLLKRNKESDLSIFNCGTLMRRKSDEINYKPRVGLLCNNGSVKIHYLDISKDKFHRQVDNKISDTDLDIEGFLRELEGLQTAELDFIENTKQWMEKNKPTKAVRQLVLKMMEAK